jgi:hypothetical protein
MLEWVRADVLQEMAAEARNITCLTYPGAFES